ncbi:IMPACT family protein [Alcanivorax jadensis]|uniref:IMPACT family protein n=1 Tax=Alcanivorax jadensis TaxID=64988 RepID=UPI0023533179|nr:YigZ family protein [Alcanivorax jadensis]MDF1636170.1 YigZ family protein [Alcanivorax jadensis]
MINPEFAIKGYPVPAGPVDRELLINKSRFITWLRPVASREQAMAVIDQARARYPDASHHCYAYLLGNPASAQAAMNDDGEPSGTAGKPIFNVIQHKGMSDVLVVVSRYFGGVKLGAGGLVRAYAAAAEAVLAEVERVESVPQVTCRLEMGFPLEQRLRHWAEQNSAEVLDVHYSQSVAMTLRCPTQSLDDLESLCAAEQIALTVL